MSELSLPSLIAKVVILLVGFPVHELAHAWVAYRLGDDTAQRMGRLTLNPLKHLDPLGSIMLLVSFIGWAKPVPVNEYNLRHGRLGGVLVSAAGPASNILMALLVAIPWRMGVFGNLPPVAIQILGTFAVVNIALFLFNLIPLAPLDGFRVFTDVIGRVSPQLVHILGAYGPMILLGLLMLGYISPQLNFLGRFLNAGIAFLYGLLLGGPPA